MRPHPYASTAFNDTVQIPMEGAGFFIVDAADAEAVSQYRWRLSGSGYPRATMARRQRVHVSRFLTSAPKGMVVDHINGDTLDNRRCNLRVCTQSQNTQNTKRPARRRYPDLPTGVYPTRKGTRFSSTIMVAGKANYLGWFKTVDEAAAAYQAAALRLHAEYSVLNRPIDPNAQTAFADLPLPRHTPGAAATPAPACPAVNGVSLRRAGERLPFGLNLNHWESTN